MDQSNPPSSVRNAIAPAVTLGTFAAVFMWCVWYLTHLPAVASWNLPVAVLILAAMAGALAQVPAMTTHVRPWLVGLIAGGFCGMLNLLVLGAYLAEPASDVASPSPGAEGLRPGAVLFVPGFLVLMSVLGAGCAQLGSVLFHHVPMMRRFAETRAEPSPRHVLATYAKVMVIAIAPLLFVGGVVTSTRSGLAVPDWPGTYGANMFLYPIGLMVQEQTPEIFYEHSHRLLGALVGLVSLTFLVFSLVSSAGRGGRARLWTLILFLAITGQGLIGMFRVLSGTPMGAIVHGVAAQIIFALAVAIAVWISPTYRDVASGSLSIEPSPSDRRAKFFTTGLLHALILQLVLGAAVRHFRHAGSPGAMHALWTHAGFAIIVMIFALIAGYTLMGRKIGPAPLNRTIPRAGLLLVILVGVQFVLGWIALFVVLHAPHRGPVPTSDQLAEAPRVGLAEVLITTSHQINGALLLATATFAWAWMRRLHRASRPHARET